MSRQSITLATQNDEWLKQQVANQEFTSKSEAVNFLNKQARRQEEYFEYVRNKINLGEKSGLTKKQSKEEMLVEFKKRLNVSF